MVAFTCKSNHSNDYPNLIDYSYDLILVTMAAVIPMLDKIIQLVGALSSSFVAVIFPPIVQVVFFSLKYIIYSNVLTYITLLTLFLKVFALWEDRDKMSELISKLIELIETIQD